MNIPQAVQARYLTESVQERMVKSISFLIIYLITRDYEPTRCFHSSSCHSTTWLFTHVWEGVCTSTSITTMGWDIVTVVAHSLCPSGARLTCTFNIQKVSDSVCVWTVNEVPSPEWGHLLSFSELSNSWQIPFTVYSHSSLSLNSRYLACPFQLGSEIFLFFQSSSAQSLIYKIWYNSYCQVYRFSYKGMGHKW